MSAVNNISMGSFEIILKKKCFKNNSINLKIRLKKVKDLNKNIKNFFDWIKGAELVELKVVRYQQRSSQA